MNHEEFKSPLNDIIFDQSQAKLLKKISKFPEKYIGLFRPPE